MPPWNLMSPARREQRHGLGHRRERVLRCSRVTARNRAAPDVHHQAPPTGRHRWRHQPVRAGGSRPWPGAGSRPGCPGRRRRHRGALAGRTPRPPPLRGCRPRRRVGRRGLGRLRPRLRRPPANQVVGCVTVPASDTRYDALAAFAQEKDLTQPGYAPSGLLCSINGIPSSGCGQVVAGGYIYWAYFTGGAQAGPTRPPGASGTVGTDDVEGWRFENPGSGNPGDPGPRTAPSYDAICGSSTPTTTTTTTSVPSGGGGRRCRRRSGWRRWPGSDACRPEHHPAAPGRRRRRRGSISQDPIDHHVVHASRDLHVDLAVGHLHLVAGHQRPDRPRGGPGQHAPRLLRRVGARGRPDDHRRPAGRRPGHRRLRPLAEAPPYSMTSRPG